ncbi:MAG: carboxyl-terminal protease [Acidobacteria bacterium]|nr:carboxyl-terminal protease [Acidobacteriota bacterium]
MNNRLRFWVVSLSTFLVALLVGGAVVGTSAPPDEPYRHLGVYTEVLSRIKSEYVEEPDIKNVTLGAINGMLESIDPYSSFLNTDQYKQYQQYLKNGDGKKAAVGLIISKKFGYVGVVDAIPGSSAFRAGLTTGDMIETINGVATRDMPLAYAEILLKGEPNTSVEMSVLRLRKPEPTKITLTRSVLRYPTVLSRTVGSDIGLIQVQACDPGKVKEVAATVEQLQKQGAKKLILDLRSNAVGDPRDGLALANLFIDKGLLGYLQGQKAARENTEADPSKALTKDRLVVLTNRGTARAAEVAAAALLDSKRADIVGERTYGDAAVRKPITLDDGSAVILSVAKYHSPSGKAIQDTGVTPNYPVIEFEPQGDDDTSLTEPQARAAEDDAILKKAIELLTTGKIETAPLARDPQTGVPGGAAREGMPPTVVKPEDKKK